jgi:hypothetical protein
MEPRNTKEYKDKMEEMISFFDTCYDTPDRVSYMTLVAGIRDAVLHSKNGDDEATAHAKRYLQKAGRFRDSIMELDVMKCMYFRPHDAEEFLNQLGTRADYPFYLALIKTYERAATHDSPGTTEYGEKAEALLRTMERLSETNRSFRPTFHVYNSVIISWLASDDIAAVERADAVLQSLLERYQRRVQATMDSGEGPQWVVERPNTTTFALVLGGYARHGALHHIEKMEHILQQMGDLELARAQASKSLKPRLAIIESECPHCQSLAKYVCQFQRSGPRFAC